MQPFGRPGHQVYLRVAGLRRAPWILNHLSYERQGKTERTEDEKAMPNVGNKTHFVAVRT